MKLTTIDHQTPADEKRQGSSDRRSSSGPVNDGTISQLFRAYFNNKMTLLIFLIQAKTLKLNSQTVEEITRFLDDIFHHMLTGEAQRQYQETFESLKSFFRILPDVSQEQRDLARELIRNIYQAVGIDLKADI
jgi:hypothetical protein